MRNLIYGVLAAVLIIPAGLIAQDLTVTINGTEVQVYSKAAMDSLLASKSDVGHTHAIADVTGLQTAIDDLDARVAALETSTFIGVAPEAGNVAQALWAGSQADYDAIGTKDPNTVYIVIP